MLLTFSSLSHVDSNQRRRRSRTASTLYTSTGTSPQSTRHYNGSSSLADIVNYWSATFPLRVGNVSSFDAWKHTVRDRLELRQRQ